MSNELENLKAVSNGIIQFSPLFYKTLVEEKKVNNVVCSPISLSTILSMAAYGARGNTEKELQTALHLPVDDNVTKDGIQKLLETLNSVKNVELHLANSIFINNELEVKKEFKNIIENIFNSESRFIDFTQAVEASKEINSWCEDKTNKCIKSVIEPDDLQDVGMVLINAIYFKGLWGKKFNPENTQSAPFYLTKDSKIDVPTMYINDHFNFGYLDDLKATYVELPYESNDKTDDAISMFIILPDEEESSLDHVEANIDKINFANLERHEMKIDLWLPKFKIESKLDLKEPLQKMGMKDMFEDSANFSGIIDSPRLKVGKVIQKAFLEVSEEGTEAAAVTGMGFMLMCLPPQININRPFFCSVVSLNTGVPLFYARIIDPSSG